MHQAVAPPAEVRTDYETLCALAERLGFLDEFSEGRDGDEWVRHFYESTRDDLHGHGVDLPGYEEFREAGRIAMPTPPQRRRELDFAALRADPAASPLPTPSGRIEIASATSPASATTTAPATRSGWSRRSGSAASSQPASRCT